MTIYRVVLTLKCCLMLLVACSVGDVWAARNSRSHSAIRFGVLLGPVWRPWPYSSPYYYPPYPPMMIDPPPSVYIEQYVPPPAELAPAAPVNYWYYCEASKAYYPYVNECPTGWQKVLQQAPSPQ